MKRVQVITRIEGSPEQVWAVLTDFPRYPEWNPFIQQVEGRLMLGEHLDVRMQLEGQKPSSFQPAVHSLMLEREFSWLGRLGGIPGLFDGLHSFRLETNGTGTNLIHEETFRGLLSGPLIAWMGDRLPRAFAAMNAALKNRVELQHFEASAKENMQ